MITASIPYKNSLKIFLLIFLLIFFFSCSHKKDIKRDTALVKKPAKVIVMPFKKITSSLEKDIKCNISDKSVVCSYPDTTFKQIGRQLATDFYYALKNKRKDYHPVMLDTVERAFNTPLKNIPIFEIVKRFKIDYIIEGFVYKFVEREGSEFSVKKPATVHFVISVRDTNTGDVVWQREYLETQQELSKNLLNILNFFKRKAKWLTALELSEMEIDKIVTELP